MPHEPPARTIIVTCDGVVTQRLRRPVTFVSDSYFYYCPFCLERWGTVAIEGCPKFQGWSCPCAINVAKPHMQLFHQFWVPIRNFKPYHVEVLLGFYDHLAKTQRSNTPCHNQPQLQSLLLRNDLPEPLPKELQHAS